MVDRIQDALERLRRYTEQPRQANVDLSVLSPRDETSQASDQAKQTLTDVLFSVMDVSNGGLTSRQLAQRLRDFGQDSPADRVEIDKRISIYVDGNPLQERNTVEPIIGQSSSGLSLVQVDSIRITPAGRDVAAVCALLNMVPTIELSRCMPYLTIDVQTGRRPVSNDNRVQGLSLARFLGGSFDVSNSPDDRRLVLALQGKAALSDGADEQLVDVTVSGMELFTSPQVLTNPDPSIDGLRAGAVIDRFRPLMSIERFNVELTPQVGFFAYRTADLDLTLHDRSRLTEIADFIRPDLYGSTELTIEYGWSHPDASADNVFGQLLNAMRAREKYGIVNSSFSMTKAGEVKLKLKLFTRGMSDMQTVRIGDSGQAVDAIRAVRSLQKSIAAIRGRTSQENEKGSKEVRGEQQLFANAEDIGSALVLPREKRAVLVRFLNNVAKNKESFSADIKDLAAALTDLYGRDGKSGQAVKMTTSVADAIAERLRGFRKATQTSDPFLFSAKRKLERIKDINIDERVGYVSLGRLMATFVGLPLAVQGREKYDDVQLIFYPFNAKAGACANHNIAEFIIKVNDLERGLEAIARSRGLQLTLRDFLQYISNNFIDDMSSPAYGLSNFYVSSIDAETGVRTQPQQRNKNLESTSLYDHVQARLLAVGSQDGVFKPPQLDIIIETVPAAAIEDGQSQRAEGLRTVLKIHVFDKCATAYESLQSLILANREEDLRTIGNMSNNVASEHASVFNEIINRAKRQGVVRASPEGSTLPTASDVSSTLERVDATVTRDPANVYNVTFDIERLRSFIRSNVPTITYGTSNTGIKEASFATIQNPLLSTVHMLRAGETGPLSPEGLTRANLPLRTLPARVSMTIVGCPLLQYMQQFFIDFNTNTTIDNIYGLNKLTHELAPGRFESKMELVPLDAYGRYESLPAQVGTMLQHLEEIQKKSRR